MLLTNMTEYLFSYGTLQKQQLQLELFGRHLSGKRDRLKCYKLDTIEIQDEKFLERVKKKNQLTVIFTGDVNDTIEGTALEVSKDDLILSDKYEPDNYKRKRIVLESGLEAWIYMASD